MMKLASNTGMMLLGIWLIFYGVVPLLKLDFEVPADAAEHPGDCGRCVISDE